MPVVSNDGRFRGTITKGAVLSVYSQGGTLGKPGTLPPEVTPLPTDVRVKEMLAPAGVLDRPLAELKLPERHGIMILAVTRTKGSISSRELPSATTRISQGDRILAVGTYDALEKFQATFGIERGAESRRFSRPSEWLR